MEQLIGIPLKMGSAAKSGSGLRGIPAVAASTVALSLRGAETLLTA
jgi:hypothetical protein